MIKNILEFFRVISELRYIIPLLKYKWPNPDDNASLAHTFQDSVDISDGLIIYLSKELPTDINVYNNLLHKCIFIKKDIKIIGYTLVINI